MAKKQNTYTPRTPRHCEGHDCRVEPNYGDWDVDLCELHASAPTLRAQRDALLSAATELYTQLSRGIEKKHFSHSDPDGRGREGVGCYATLGAVERLGEAILAAKGGAQ